MENQSASTVVLVIGTVMLIAWLVLVNVPVAIFGSLMFRSEFGAEPRGALGWVVLFGFYIAAAWILSWPGNLKSDRHIP